MFLPVKLQGYKSLGYTLYKGLDEYPVEGRIIERHSTVCLDIVLPRLDLIFLKYEVRLEQWRFG